MAPCSARSFAPPLHSQVLYALGCADQQSPTALAVPADPLFSAVVDRRRSRFSGLASTTDKPLFSSVSASRT